MAAFTEKAVQEAWDRVAMPLSHGRQIIFRMGFIAGMKHAEKEPL